MPLALGASMRQALLRIFVPLTRPGVMVGTTMVFVISLGFFLTPAILGGGSTYRIDLHPAAGQYRPLG